MFSLLLARSNTRLYGASFCARSRSFARFTRFYLINPGCGFPRRASVYGLRNFVAIEKERAGWERETTRTTAPSIASKNLPERITRAGTIRDVAPPPPPSLPPPATYYFADLRPKSAYSPARRDTARAVPLGLPPRDIDP